MGFPPFWDAERIFAPPFFLPLSEKEEADGIFFLLLQKENVCAPILFASIRRMFFRPHFLFSFRKGNGVEPPKEKRAWGNLSNGFPTPLLATASEEARCTALPADAESSVSACSFFLSKL